MRHEEDLATKIARDIFVCGNCSVPTTRLQFMGPNELPLGGLIESALANVIRESLERHLTKAKKVDIGAAINRNTDALRAIEAAIQRLNTTIDDRVDNVVGAIDLAASANRRDR